MHASETRRHTGRQTDRQGIGYLQHDPRSKMAVCKSRRYTVHYMWYTMPQVPTLVQDEGERPLRLSTPASARHWSSPYVRILSVSVISGRPKWMDAVGWVKDRTWVRHIRLASKKVGKGTMTSYNPSRRDLANPTLGLRSKPLCRWPAALVLNLVWGPNPIGACFPSTESAVDCIF